MPKVRGRSLRVLFSAAAIAERNVELAGEIAAAGYRNLLVVSILKGSFVFAADLIRALHTAGLAPEVEFISLSSYRTGTTSTGKVKLIRDVESDIAGRDVLIIDDILEWLGTQLAPDRRGFDAGLGLAEITLVCALDWMDFRATYPTERAGAVASVRAAWAEHPSLVATRPHT
jgi:hypothetical protein